MGISAPAQEPWANEQATRPGLSWGVKSSFTRYIDTMPDGRRGAGHGATEAGDGVYFFELEDASGFDPSSPEGIVKYRGDLRYKGHQGMLFVMIVDPWIEFRDTGAVLTAVDAERWPNKEHRIELATLAPGAPAAGRLPRGWALMDARLTPAGVEVFNGVYGVGERLEPVGFCAHLKSGG
ncbi:HtaA domain-containing protein [Paeniglutamicibacter sp. ORCA_105]|uniref:HtaA domain-containing protein n=1 Tax=Paeniglutamicibacter sp. ORCA_105 TaxID=3377336 RepID=UPI003895D82E